MTDHTPGPWFLDDELPSNPYSVLARVGGEKIPISSPSDPGDARADARLIAAAPELLAECIALQMEAAARGCGLRIADEAIAKAKGTP